MKSRLLSYFVFLTICSCGLVSAIDRAEFQAKVDQFVELVFNPEQSGFEWEVRARVDELRVEEGVITDFQAALIVDGSLDFFLESDSHVHLEMGASYHPKGYATTQHTVAGFDAFDTVLWLDKQYVNLDPIKVLGALILIELAMDPEWVPEGVELTEEEIERCEQWLYGDENLDWDGEEPFEFYVFRQLIEQPVVEELVCNQRLLNAFLCEQFCVSEDDEEITVAITRWELDLQGRLTAFEWMLEIDNSFDDGMDAKRVVYQYTRNQLLQFWGDDEIPLEDEPGWVQELIELILDPTEEEVGVLQFMLGFGGLFMVLLLPVV